MGYTAALQTIRAWLGQVRFVLADKVALLLGLLSSSLLLLLWSLAFLIVGTAGARHLWENIGIVSVELDVLMSGFAWLVMRAAGALAGSSMGHRPDAAIRSNVTPAVPAGHPSRAGA